MGASRFQTTVWGKTPKKAFKKARGEAKHNHGHGGHTGTIAEKESFVEIPIPTDWGKSPSEYAEYLLIVGDKRISEEHSPAGCILLESKEDVKEVPYATTSQKSEKKGKRKWKTVYVVINRQSHFYKDDFTSQTKAVQFAKAWVKKHNQPMTIKVEQQLVNQSQRIMTIQPKVKEIKVQDGLKKYLFFGVATN